ncbi:MAG: hypothetical protein M2R45_02679 [Verrucomicrobia subdivision 3 bacterium]|nr:hypothetical protein [Limisphaerales bacterium]MCS1414055.1 hypothetical protein [Limisphaerales bacterium]
MFMANQLGHLAIQPSLILGCEQPTTGYRGPISPWPITLISPDLQSSTSPAPLEVYPSLAFDSLFENRGNLRNQSILNCVKDQADSYHERSTPMTSETSGATHQRPRD